ncbi:hypothetical protein HID58_091759, partial [Brassica napus]
VPHVDVNSWVRIKKKAETLLSLISRQLPKTLITTSRSEWNCIKNGTVVLPLSIEREVDAYLEAFLDEREDGYLRIPETSRNEYLATGNSHYPLPENILDQQRVSFFFVGTTVKTGDVVSVSGKGRLKIGEINETKKKGNMQLKSSDICRMKLIIVKFKGIN